ncbi:MAG: hypothetical protein EOO05_20235 [Chitinophagaceae bacterium]|nr:MAG: hypothetical protein EOO05_20235 [Chitinophagaceae bacterium]
MKASLTFFACFIAIQLMAGCNKNNTTPGCDKTNTAAGSPANQFSVDTMKLTINIGDKNFTATLYDNPATSTLKSALPMTIDMIELNGNEKYADLPNGLPANDSNPGTIQSGDLMLYGTNTLVLFYKSFSTSYRYTRLGRVDDPSGLAAALGTGNVTVKFSIQ